MVNNHGFCCMSCGFAYKKQKAPNRIEAFLSYVTHHSDAKFSDHAKGTVCFFYLKDVHPFTQSPFR